MKRLLLLLALLAPATAQAQTKPSFPDALLSQCVSAGPFLGGGAGLAPTCSAIKYLTSLTSGGIVYASSTTQLASSGLMTANALIIGGGAGASPTSGPAPAAAGDLFYWNGAAWAKLAGNTTTTKVLQEDSSGVPSWATVSGTGTVTSVATSSCIIGGTITTTGTIASNCTFTPQGRLTLTSGTPVLSTSVSAATTVYYTAYAGRFVPVYDGTNNTSQAICAANTTGACEVSVALGSNWVTNSNYDWFIYVDSGTVRLCSGPAWTSDTARGTGAGTTELEQFNGLWTNKVTLTCRYANASTTSAAAHTATYVGTMRTGSAGQTNFIFGANAAGGTAGLFGVWNAYNRVTVKSSLIDTTATWTQSSATPASMDASAGNRFSFITGLAEDGVAIFLNSTVTCPANCSVGPTGGMGLDSTSTFTMAYQAGNNSASVADTRSYHVSHNYTGLLGFHFVQALQAADGTHTYTWYGALGGVNANEFQLDMRM